MNATGHEKLQTQVISEAICALEKRANEIREIVYSNPFQEILVLREKAKEAIAVNGYTSSLELIKTLAKRERVLLHQARQQKRHSSALILELIGVDMQIDAFKKELFQMTMPAISKLTN